MLADLITDVPSVLLVDPGLIVGCEFIFFFKQKTADEMIWWLEFRRVLFRSVSSEALVRDIEKTKQKMRLFDFDRPVGIQIYGHNIESMVRAAQVAEESEPDFIDINLDRKSVV